MSDVPDFATRRVKLPPEAFAIGPGVEPEPTDPVDQHTWSGIVQLADDVSLRTSEHHGSFLKSAYDIWGYWVSTGLDVQSLVSDPGNDPLSVAFINASDEMQASTYAALTGFYRQAIGGLRLVVEGMLTGAYFRALPDEKHYEEWIDGRREGQVWMRDIREELAAVSPYSELDKPDGALVGRDGWINDLYQRLSAYSHGRPFYTDDAGNKVPTTNVEMWQSNGPVYEPRAFSLWSRFFMDSVLLAVLLAGLAEPGLADLKQPEDIPYASFVSDLIKLHPAPRPVVKPIVQHLFSDD